MRVRRIVVAGVVGLVAACTSEPTEQPAAPEDGPEAAGEDADEPAPPLDEAAAAELYVRWQHLLVDLPLTEPADLELGDRGEDVLVPGSPAEEFTIEALADVAADEVAYRGDVVAETTRLRRVEPDVVQALVCASFDVEPTSLSTGEATDAVPFPDAYGLREVTYRLVDDVWLVTDGRTPQDAGCVPPDVEAEVTAGWEAYVDALEDWLRRGAPDDDVGDLASLADPAHMDALRASPGLDPDARHEREDVNHDPEVIGAGRGWAQVEWCFDPGRNEEAGRYDADGTFTPLTELQEPRYEWTQWELVDGDWLLASQVAMVPDHPRAEEDHRCL